ncbi:MAG TPA: Maf family protein, partial [Bacteroidales bacterium]|nr:Maf family protein [Bacteroidales bacterium]
HEVALMVAYRKALAFGNELLNEKTIVIAADTIVVLQEKILNKPAGYEQAKEMLSLLSGNTHHVITGVCIGHKTNFRCFHETTSVRFRELSEQEIDFYLAKFRPYDKAGSYGIQEWIGLTAVKRIEGSYSNVVGLPVERVYTELKAILGF